MGLEAAAASLLSVLSGFDHRKKKSRGDQVDVESREGRKVGSGEEWVGTSVLLEVRAGGELLRGLTLSSWEVSPSPHCLPMLPPQTKLPLGQGIGNLGVLGECAVGLLGWSLPGYQKVKQSFPGTRGE